MSRPPTNVFSQMPKHSSYTRPFLRGMVHRRHRHERHARAVVPGWPPMPCATVHREGQCERGPSCVNHETPPGPSRLAGLSRDPRGPLVWVDPMGPQARVPSARGSEPPPQGAGTPAGRRPMDARDGPRTHPAQSYPQTLTTAVGASPRIVYSTVTAVSPPLRPGASCGVISISVGKPVVCQQGRGRRLCL